MCINSMVKRIKSFVNKTPSKSILYPKHFNLLIVQNNHKNHVFHYSINRLALRCLEKYEPYWIRKLREERFVIACNAPGRHHTVTLCDPIILC